jgi:hypothetical protein
MSASEDSLTAGTLIDGARMYAAAADAVNERMPNALHVLSHLLCTSIELALKAHLRHIGYTEGQLRKLGHDLRQLFVECSQHGLDYTGSRSFVLFVAGANYRDRLFAYPQEGVMNVIIPRRLREMCRELICDVLPGIKGAEAFQTLVNEPGIAILSDYPEELNASAWAQQTVDGGAA